MFKFIKKIILSQIDVEIENINKVCAEAGQEIDDAISAALKF